MCPSGTQHFTCPLVTRIFDGDFVPRLDRHSRYQIKSLLGSVDDDHLFGIADNCARSSEVGTDRTTERRASSSRRVVKLSHTRLPRAALKDATPSLERKELNVTDAEREIIVMGTGRLRRDMNCAGGAASGNSKTRKRDLG